jgi:lipocalin
MTANENIEGGGFYLDRSPQVKHIAGPFFTEGCFTKNTPEEVSSIMSLLERWSTLPFNEGPLEVLLPNERVSRINFEASLTPLVAMDEQIDLHRYMGRWYVQANIPTSFDQDTINNIEEYVWDDDRKKVSVCFKYCNPLKHVKNGEEVVSPGPVKEILQIGTPLSDNGTEWALKVKLFFYIPVPLRYLIIGINEDVPGSNFHERTVAEGEYVSCMIGVADRSAIWIMNRDKTPMS